MRTVNVWVKPVPDEGVTEVIVGGSLGAAVTVSVPAGSFWRAQKYGGGPVPKSQLCAYDPGVDGAVQLNVAVVPEYPANESQLFP